MSRLLQRAGCRRTARLHRRRQTPLSSFIADVERPAVLTVSRPQGRPAYLGGSVLRANRLWSMHTPSSRHLGSGSAAIIQLGRRINLICSFDTHRCSFVMIQYAQSSVYLPRRRRSRRIIILTRILAGRLSLPISLSRRTPRILAKSYSTMICKNGNVTATSASDASSARDAESERVLGIKWRVPGAMGPIAHQYLC